MGPIVCIAIRSGESEAQYAPRNAEIQPRPDYANTSTNMGEGFEDSMEGRIFGSFVLPAAASVEEGSPRQRARRTTRKKVPNIENEKKREREAGKVPLLPFLIRSFHAAEAARPPRPLPQSFSLARGPLSSFSSLLSSSFFVVAAKKNGASHALTSSPDMRKMAQNQSLNLESIG